ncbi:MAG: hypothetical protein R3F10_06205 [Lysobacteraceae bacterium]
MASCAARHRAARRNSRRIVQTVRLITRDALGVGDVGRCHTDGNSGFLAGFTAISDLFRYLYRNKINRLTRTCRFFANSDSTRSPATAHRQTKPGTWPGNVRVIKRASGVSPGAASHSARVRVVTFAPCRANGCPSEKHTLEHRRVGPGSAASGGGGWPPSMPVRWCRGCPRGGGKFYGWMPSITSTRAANGLWQFHVQPESRRLDGTNFSIAKVREQRMMLHTSKAVSHGQAITINGGSGLLGLIQRPCSLFSNAAPGAIRDELALYFSPP